MIVDDDISKIAERLQELSDLIDSEFVEDNIIPADRAISLATELNELADELLTAITDNLLHQEKGDDD